MNKDTKTLVDTKELAELLGMQSIETIRKWCREGKIPFVTTGNRYRFDVAAVLTVLGQTRIRSRNVGRMTAVHSKGLSVAYTPVTSASVAVAVAPSPSRTKRMSTEGLV